MHNPQNDRLSASRENCIFAGMQRRPVGRDTHAGKESIMKHANPAFKGNGQPFELGRYGALPLTDAYGARVRSLRGTLWITQEGDSADHLVGAGEDFTVNRDGMTLVTAVEGPSTLVVTRPVLRSDGMLERWLQRTALVMRPVPRRPGAIERWLATSRLYLLQSRRPS
jgi:hypothetical protein